MGEAHTTCIEFEADLFDKIFNDNDITGGISSPQTILHSTLVNRSANNTLSVREVRSEPVYK